MPNQSPVFHDDKGRLTHYALACGYIESYEMLRVSACIDMEHQCISVVVFDHGNGKRLAWENFGKRRADAYKYYERWVKAIKQGKKEI